MPKLLIKEYDCLTNEDAGSCFKIAFLSDLHGAVYKTRDGKDRIVEAVRRSEPDIVIACVIVLAAASIAAIMLRKPAPPIDNTTVVGLKTVENM